MRIGITTLLATSLLLTLLTTAGDASRAAAHPDDRSGLDDRLAALVAELGDPLGAPLDPMSDPAGLMALALREASRHEARARFWKRAALAVNGPVESRNDALQDAIDEMDEEMGRAQVQFDARIDLFLVLGLGRHDPDLDPADFSPNVTHPLHPLVPGRTLVYERSTSEGLERVEVTTRHDTVVIGGITCRVVRELEFLDGQVVEDTDNWFAQKSDGSVWYFGELSKHFEDGFLTDIDGSWRAGEDGARPGMIMPTTPTLGDAYRQEFHLNGSEDFARVISLGETVPLASGPVTGCVQIHETSPLEPEERERKFYAPNIGLVRELDLNTGEVLDLIQIID